MECSVKLIWDEKEQFWYSKSLNKDFGLTLESNSLDTLIEKVRMAVPDMFEIIGYQGKINLSFIIERVDKLEVVAS